MLPVTTILIFCIVLKLFGKNQLLEMFKPLLKAQKSSNYCHIFGKCNNIFFNLSSMLSLIAMIKERLQRTCFVFSDTGNQPQLWIND